MILRLSFNQSITQLKNTSLVSTIAVPDLLYNGTLITADTYRPLEVYTVVAVIYFVLTVSQHDASVVRRRRLQNDRCTVDRVGRRTATVTTATVAAAKNPSCRCRRPPGSQLPPLLSVQDERSWAGLLIPRCRCRA